MQTKLDFSLTASSFRVLVGLRERVSTEVVASKNGAARPRKACGKFALPRGLFLCAGAVNMKNCKPRREPKTLRTVKKSLLVLTKRPLAKLLLNKRSQPAKTTFRKSGQRRLKRLLIAQKSARQIPQMAGNSSDSAKSHFYHILGVCFRSKNAFRSRVAPPL